MSSGGIPQSSHPQCYVWQSDLDPANYLLARYQVCSACDGEAVALGMAMEQSAATVAITGYVEPHTLHDWTIRVWHIQPVAEPAPSDVASYQLATEVYADHRKQQQWYQIELAIPLKLLGRRASQLFNIVIGELPRLGYLSGFILQEARLPATFGPGPAFGIAGIRQKVQQTAGPLLCRSMRPAVGLDTATMQRINRDVLAGGFHLVKDDELASFADQTCFEQHLQAMLAARDDAMQQSGERKLYIANLLCEPDELPARWDAAYRLGVDGVLVAPFIQGLGVLPMLARQAQLPLLAHQTFAEMLTRHPHWQIADSVLGNWLRQLGADWFVTPGPFATSAASHADHAALLAAACGSASARPMLPIVQGGKHPGGLTDYRTAIGSDDYMLIVASWLDRHPAGLRAAAAEFRAAVDAGFC